jgi:Sec-independent protein translocase protein TatA
VFRWGSLELGLFELLVVLILGILILGPEKLPEFAQTLGKYVREFNKLRQMLESEIKKEITSVEKPLKEITEAPKDMDKKAKVSRRRAVGLRKDVDEEIKGLAEDLGISTEGKTRKEIIAEIRAKVKGEEDDREAK